VKEPAGDVSRANQIDRFLGRDQVGGAANVRAADRIDLRPRWQGTTRTDLGRVDANLNSALRTSATADVKTSNWLDSHPNRAEHWSNWAGDVKNSWNSNGYHSSFNNHFWATHSVFFPWGYGYYWWGARPWWYWWTFPTWHSCAGWFPGWGWNSPYYYDYGLGGNVVYYTDGVYVNGQLVGTPADYAQSAAALATVDRADVDPKSAGEWLPLGTFALAVNRDDKNPDRVVQLAVDKQGIVSGSMFDRAADKTYPIQGRVDKETQRVAFTIGDNPDLVMETGMYNLTQDQTPVLVHKGTDITQTNLLIRLEQPQRAQSPRAAPRGVER
jgi:hypothetical protein